jgi:hypothetical protein
MYVAAIALTFTNYFAFRVHHNASSVRSTSCHYLLQKVVSRFSRSVLRCRDFALLGVFRSVDGYSYLLLSILPFLNADKSARVAWTPRYKYTGLPSSRQSYV